MTFTTENLEKVELYRYWGSIGLFSLYVLLILLSFIAICCRSKVFSPTRRLLTFQGMMLGITCALFFALAICHLTLYAQLSIGVGLSDYCADPKAAQKSSLELPGAISYHYDATLPVIRLLRGGANKIIIFIRGNPLHESD